MGNSSSTYDVNLEYSKKTLKELASIRLQFEDAVRRHPESKMFNEHLEFVRMKIAERIGKCGK